MINSNIVIGILAKDCKESLENNIPRVEKLGNMFSEYHVVVYENNSKDGTTELLQTWAKSNPHVHAICETAAETPLPHKSAHCPRPSKSIQRIGKMATLRNRLMDEISSRFSPDYVLMIDIDIQSFEPLAVVRAIEKAPADWGGLFASGHILFTNSDGTSFTSPFQYDTYALIQKGTDYRKTRDWCLTHNFHLLTAWKTEEKLSQCDYLPVTSAFNGLGIYRWSIIKDIRYTTEQTEEMKDKNCCFCEHVPFNNHIVEQGYGNYLVRDLEVIYFEKKNTILRSFNRWKDHLLVKILYGNKQQR